MTVFTVGYEGLDIDGFMPLLSGHRIQTAVDVRELPLSREPGFSKKAMSRTLEIRDIGYVHSHCRAGLPETGARRLSR